MQINVFEYSDYKKYLNDWLEKRTPKIKGGRSRMAEAMGSKHSYLSRVLNEDAHISLEQGQQLNGFLGHTDTEAHFFLLLVGQGRADTASLRAYYKKQIDELRDEYQGARGKNSAKLSLEQQSIYYSEWYYAAIHMFLLTGMEPADISKHLRLNLSTVKGAIEFLMDMGLVVLEKGRYRLREKHFNLVENSLFYARHYTNWRMRAVKAMESVESEDTHRSVICALSEKDIPKVKNVMLEAMVKVKAIVDASGEDAVACVNFDVFKV